MPYVALTLLALLIAVLILAAEPFATPLYATAPVEVKQFEIAAGDSYERFFQMPWATAAAMSLMLLAITAYLEFFTKLQMGKLPKAIAVLALFYGLPLPYVYVVGGGDLVVVLSNYAKFVSLPLFGLALLIAVTESLLTPQRRARVIADLSITEEKTEKEA
jgi:hypothetical protein